MTDRDVGGRYKMSDKWMIKKARIVVLAVGLLLQRGVAGRAYHTLVTMDTVAFVGFLNCWNLLGWRY